MRDDTLIIMYLCILDFEATCDLNMKAQGRFNEVIEFPSVLLKITYNNENLNPLIEKKSDIQIYCKPKCSPFVSKFCNNLTGITQEQVDNGFLFSDALVMHELWLKTHITNFDDEVDKNNVYIITCGHWDLNIMATAEYKRYNINPHKVYKSYINIKDDFTRFYKREKNLGMAGMLRQLNLELNGRHHSGIDDCHNIAKIIIKLFEDGFKYDMFKINKVNLKN